MYKILIVEDEHYLRKGLRYSIDFAELNCVVVGEASNGQEGVEQIKVCKPDLVITDINMPLMNGLEMIEATILTAKYSAIILSGYSEFEYAKKAINFGVSHYLLKPVNHDELKNAINKAIKELEMKQSFESVNQNSKFVLDKKLLITPHSLSPIINKTIEIISLQYASKLTVQDLVNQLDISATSLNNKFKQETGLTFNDYLNRFRISMAIHFLKENKYPIYQISEKCGFSDVKYFNLVFKKYMECSPSEYRQLVEF